MIVRFLCLSPSLEEWAVMIEKNNAIIIRSSNDGICKVAFCNPFDYCMEPPTMSSNSAVMACWRVLL